jgi:glycosyltransferase involved in cell wall biosynthesis
MSIRLLSRGSPDQVSGGYLYNKYLMQHLREAGLDVTYHAEPSAIERFGDNDTVIVDSLVVGAMARRLLTSNANLILLLHVIPQGDETVVEALYRRSRIVVTGDSTLTTLRERLASDGVDAVKIEPGVPAHWRTKGRYPDTARHLLTVANYIGGKGIERMLDRLPSIQNLPWSWTVYGNCALDPSYFTAMVRKAAAYGLSERVRLLGPISHQAVNEQMVSSDLLVHLSDHESYSMVTAEAIAAGLPVLSYRTGNHGVFCRSGLVRYLDHGALADEVLSALIGDCHAYGKLRRIDRPERRTWRDVGREFLDWLGSRQ